MINLDVTIFKQTKDFNCGPTTALMLLNYYSKDIDKDSFLESLDRDKHKTNIFDLAYNLQKASKLKTNLTYFNFGNLKNEWIEKSIAKAQENVNLRHDIFSIKEIEGLLKKGWPVITLVSVRELRKKKISQWTGHFILIKGFDDEHFIINDPHEDPDKFGEHKIKKDHLLISIAKTNYPAILWIENGSRTVN